MGFSAIRLAEHADLVVVAPGTYHERLDFLGKTIAVTGTDPTDPTDARSAQPDAFEPDNSADQASALDTRGGTQRHP